MKITRKYLTAEEIGVVVEGMLEKDNEYERQMVKYGVVAQLLGIVEVTEDMDCNGIYTELVKNDIDLDVEIVNLYLVDKIVREETGVAKVVESILNGVIQQLDESMKNIDPKALLVELNNMRNGVK